MTLEHAIQLHMLLPWFTVAYYGATDMADMAKKFPKEKYPNLDLSKYKMSSKQLAITQAAFAKGTLRYVISTMVFRQGVNFVDLQVLIRGDGTVSAIDGIQIPGRVARLSDGKTYGYLIDVDDRFCTWSQRRATARKALYKEQQWIEVSREEVIDDLRAESGTNNTEPAGQHYQSNETESEKDSITVE